VPDLRLKDAAKTLMDAVVDGLNALGVDVPARRYVHSGQFAADEGPGAFNCDDAEGQLVVSWLGTGSGVVGQDTTGLALKCIYPTYATFEVSLLRCVPMPDDDGSFPSAGELNDSGEAILTDAASLVKAIVTAANAGDVPGGCKLMGFGLIQPYGPEGGVGGVLVQVVVGL
jgi:hypothetical protein